MNSTADLLRQAKEAIETRGWVQGSFEKSGGVCALGALFTLRDRYTTKAEEALIEALRDLYPGLYIGERSNSPNVVNFNDAKGRTKEEVLHLFDHAIRKAATQ